MQPIVTAIDIEATPEAVWALLMDWRSYPSWNPFIRTITGRAKVGHHVEIRIGLPVGTVVLNAVVTRLRRPAEIAWKSRLPIAGILDRHHAISIKAQPGGCRLTQTQTFSGRMASAVSVVAVPLARSGSERMNAALKAKVESRIGGGGLDEVSARSAAGQMSASR